MLNLQCRPLIAGAWTYRGSMQYSSPEAWDPSQGQGPASDIWSAGVTILMLLSSCDRPWSAASELPHMKVQGKDGDVLVDHWLSVRNQLA